MTQHTPIALITGGNRGLGRASALALAQAGNDVILSYRSNEAEAQAVVAQIAALGRRGVALRLDVADSASFPAFATTVREALQRHWQRERFDYLVNNAGTGLHMPFADTSEAQFDELMKVHFKGPYFLTQQLLALIADGGRIVNVSSGLARFSMPGASAYAAMKGAIEVLTRYLATELGARGIAVNTVAPGAIATDFNGGTVRDNPQINAAVASHTALGRVGQAEDIGGVIASLLAPANGWINGQRIEASGGMFL
ncbi:MAG: SDR family NAD(P)-dependent oxidoreductase [Solimonas sp.]